MKTSQNANDKTRSGGVHVERSYQRFTLGQRWEHGILLVLILILALTGLPQKYRGTAWGLAIISGPERLELVRQIHHLAALALTALVLYHLGRMIYLLVKRRLPGDMLPVWQDVRDAGQMLKYLFFLTRQKPKFGKYNFEQKITYWFVFFGIGILVLSGYILWFPETLTRFLPGGVVPAAVLAHSNEAVVLLVFMLVWHIYHVHIERLNLSIFTGKLSEEEMHTYHTAEFERLTGEKAGISPGKGGRP